MTGLVVGVVVPAAGPVSAMEEDQRKCDYPKIVEEYFGAMTGHGWYLRHVSRPHIPRMHWNHRIVWAE